MGRSGSTHSGRAAIQSSTVVVPGTAPAAVARRRSRSVTMPTGWLRSTTTAEPTRWDRIRSATAASVSPGSAVTTSSVMAWATVVGFVIRSSFRRFVLDLHRSRAPTCCQD